MLPDVHALGVTTAPPHVMVILMEDSASTTPVVGVIVYSLVPILARAENDELDQYTDAIFALDVPEFLRTISV